MLRGDECFKQAFQEEQAFQVQQIFLSGEEAVARGVLEVMPQEDMLKDGVLL